MVLFYFIFLILALMGFSIAIAAAHHSRTHEPQTAVDASHIPLLSESLEVVRHSVIVALRPELEAIVEMTVRREMSIMTSRISAAVADTGSRGRDLLENFPPDEIDNTTLGPEFTIRER